MTSNERGQYAILAVGLIGLLLVMMLGILALAQTWEDVAFVQGAADAAATAGAAQQIVRQVSVGGKTVCAFSDGIDPQKAVQAATALWEANVNNRFKTGRIALAPVSRNPDAHVNPDGTFTWKVTVRIREPLVASFFSFIGKNGVVEQSYAATAKPVSAGCDLPFKGPVFPTGNASLPPGWPDPGAVPVWNFPQAGRNAPSAQARTANGTEAGWPVYFVKIFHLDHPDTLTIYANADDWVQVQVDGTVVIDSSFGVGGAGSEWNAVKRGQVVLQAGDHVLVAKAENGALGHKGPNPARFVLAAYTSDGSLLFDTQPNPVENGGKPKSKYDWASWSPPNGNWVVYQDLSYPSSWVARSDAIAQELSDAGFTIRNAQDLAAWMGDAIQSGAAPNSVAVFAQDVAPDTVADQEGTGALIRRFLDAGGSVLWLGDVPFYFQGHAGGTLTQWSQQGMVSILGVGDDARHWNRAAAPQATAAGQGYGVGGSGWTAGTSVRAVPTYQSPTADGMNCQLENLATNPNGGSAYWRVGYWPNAPDALGGCDGWDQYFPQAWPNDSPGFVRILDQGVDGSDGAIVSDVLAVAGQMAGWFIAQDGQ